MKKFKTVASAFVLALILAPTTVLAEPVEATEFSQLPPEIRNIIDTAQPITILSVVGVEGIKNNYVYVDELIIQKDSSIVFNDMTAPFLAVIAKRVRVVDGSSRFSIARTPLSAPLNGENGENGANGSRGGRSGKNGTKGSNGTNAAPGAEGSSFDLPPVYVIFGKLESASDGSQLAAWNISYDFNGDLGGAGGNGGDGGLGGKGGSGKKWKSGGMGIGCGSGPGKGGDGGNGGNGGNGASGGDGGDGSDIFFFGTRSLVDVISLGSINNYGANPGESGKGGKAGAGGSGGNAGSSGNCDPVSNGSSGKAGKAGVPGSVNANAGERGVVKAYIAASADDIF